MQRWIVSALLVVAALCLRSEYQRLQVILDAGAPAALMLSSWLHDSTAILIVLASLPVLILFSRRNPGRTASPRSTESPESVLRAQDDKASDFSQLPAAVLVSAAALLCSVYTGRLPVAVSSDESLPFSSLPPAYHDEYSYLLQADTLLSGRLAWPPAPARPDLFHQFHVLNESVTASRYFPLTAAWLAPFVAVGFPVFGQYAANALAAGVLFLALRQFAARRAALVGGLLAALSPGAAIFSNLLLSHSPTMLALSVFLWMFLRFQRTSQPACALFAGGALAAAMLGRPMTAAGFALPFGIWLALSAVFRSESRVILMRACALLGVCITVGLFVLSIFNSASTGHPLRTAYQEYTDLYTPGHRYGFSNAVGNALPGSQAVPDSVREYDRWAENLTPARAVTNVWTRWRSSLQWSLAWPLITLGLGVAVPHAARVFFGRVRSGSAEQSESSADSDLRGCGLSAAPMVPSAGLLLLTSVSVVSLHLVHMPYWFTGIMNWHYVFETGPLLLGLTGIGLSRLTQVISTRLPDRTARRWTVCLVAAGLLPCWVSSDFFWGASKVEAAVSELAFSRLVHYRFNRLLQQVAEAEEGPSLVLVDETNWNPQTSLIINEPSYSAKVLVCRLPEEAGLSSLADAFPDRKLWLVDPNRMEIRPLDGP